MALAAILAVLLAGCAGSAPQPTPTPAAGVSVESVSFTTQDGVQLSGTLYRPPGAEQGAAAVLAHMRPTDQTSWAATAQELAAHGTPALTFDFRGYGRSGGKKDYSALDLDVKAALAYLADAGYAKQVCIGASMGGTACAKAASSAGLAGLAVISSPLEMEAPLTVTAADLANLDIPKLFVASEDDHPYIDDVHQMADWSPEPKQVHVFPGNAHGTYLFDGDHAAELSQLLLDFVAGLSAG
jgi:pimeloyl-ACP methyl ester carboxylesterase